MELDSIVHVFLSWKPQTLSWCQIVVKQFFKERKKLVYSDRIQANKAKNFDENIKRNSVNQLSISQHFKYDQERLQRGTSEP